MECYIVRSGDMDDKKGGRMEKEGVDQLDTKQMKKQWKRCTEEKRSLMDIIGTRQKNWQGTLWEVTPYKEK